MHSLSLRSRQFVFLMLLGGCAAFLQGCPTGGKTIVVPQLFSIAVTPKNPSVAAGNKEQFTATGNHSDGSTQNLTSSATWVSSDTSVDRLQAALIYFENSRVVT